MLNTSSLALRKLAASLSLGLGAAALSPLAHAALPAVQQQQGIEYVTGGIGHDESDSMKAAMSTYPLALTFSTLEDGKAAYTADVSVNIQGASHQNVFSAESDGPYMLVRLKPGTYYVSAVRNGKTMTRKVEVPAHGTARVVLEWHASKMKSSS